MFESVELSREILVLALAVAASFTDLAWGKIPNALTVPAILLGLAVNVLLDAQRGGGGTFLTAHGNLVSSVVGALTGLALLGPLARAGAMGGGDVKLVMAVGAMKGFGFTIWTVACGSLVGAVLGLGAILLKGRFREGVAGAARMALRPWMWRQELEQNRAPVTIPYGLALSLGAMWTWAVWNRVLGGS